MPFARRISITLLPAELIASRPPDRRDAARMLVVNRADGTITHAHFVEFPSFLRPGDRVVLNNTQVVRARFISDDGRVEILRLESPAKDRWRCLVKPGKKTPPWRHPVCGRIHWSCPVGRADGSRVIAWDRPPDESEHGHLALPPLHRSRRRAGGPRALPDRLRRSGARRGDCRTDRRVAFHAGTPGRRPAHVCHARSGCGNVPAGARRDGRRPRDARRALPRRSAAPPA